MSYIKIYRTLMDWGWHDDPNTLSLWIHLLVNANWKDGEWHGEPIGRGQMLTSVSKLSALTGLSDKQVRTCLDRLVDGGEIVKEGANKWTKITICKYDRYQAEEDEDGRTSGEQTAIIEEEKKDTKTVVEVKEKTRTRFVKPTVDEIRAFCQERGYSIDAEYFFNFYESKGWVVGKSPMKDWKAAVRTWIKKRQEDGSLFQSQPTQQQEPIVYYHSLEELEAARKAKK